MLTVTCTLPWTG